MNAGWLRGASVPAAVLHKTNTHHREVMAAEAAGEVGVVGGRGAKAGVWAVRVVTGVGVGVRGVS
jgi:hypothetical protein